MCPPLDERQAARCQVAFLSDLLRRVRSGVDAHVVLAAAPDHDAPVLAALASEHGAELSWQGAGDLGVRLGTAFLRAARERAEALVIGADSPDLPVDYLERGFREAQSPGMVLGPCDDGGFYLIAMNGLVALEGVPWGGASVLEHTIARATTAGATVRLLPWWYDVDDVEGLRRLALRLRVARTLGDDAGLPACGRLLSELEDEGLTV